MKIGICGGSSTGKTTLCNDIAVRYGLTPIVDLRTQYMQENNVDWKEIKNSSDKYLMFQYEILNKHILAESREDAFVSDRISLSYAVYTLKYGPKVKNVIEEYIDYAVNHYLKTYDYIIYISVCDMNRKIENNGIRIADYQYQRSFEFTELGLINFANNREKEINSDSKSVKTPEFIYVPYDDYKTRFRYIEERIGK